MPKIPHTPGPWWLSTRYDAIVADAKPSSFNINEERTLDGGMLICESVSRENLHLIAAAPDLEAACRAALERLVPPGELYEPSEPVGRLLLAALSKAQGVCWKCYPHSLHAAGKCEYCDCNCDDGGRK